MALSTNNSDDSSVSKILIRFQELNPESINGRPYEEDLVEDGMSADSIGDIPLPGDFILLSVNRMIPDTYKNPQFQVKEEIFKVLTRLFVFKSISNKDHSICNVVVEPVNDAVIIGKLIKD